LQGTKGSRGIGRANPPKSPRLRFRSGRPDNRLERSARPDERPGLRSPSTQIRRCLDCIALTRDTRPTKHEIAGAIALQGGVERTLRNRFSIVAVRSQKRNRDQGDGAYHKSGETTAGHRLCKVGERRSLALERRNTRPQFARTTPAALSFTSHYRAALNPPVP
jgi:hypothetical protein